VIYSVERKKQWRYGNRGRVPCLYILQREVEESFGWRFPPHLYSMIDYCATVNIVPGICFTGISFFPGSINTSPPPSVSGLSGYPKTGEGKRELTF